MGQAPAPREQREGGEGEERRERRSRDRYGRDRRERGPRDETTAASNEGAALPASTEERRPRYPTGFVSDAEVAETQQPVQQEVPQEVVAAPAPQAAPAQRHMPKVTPFELPVNELAQVAEGSGLQWINSDAEKIAAVQAAIAAEPKPVRVPRERPPIVVIDEGPLVLVETRRDLRDLKLPFEQQALPLQ
jgi:ribonuclease E